MGSQPEEEIDAKAGAKSDSVPDTKIESEEPSSKAAQDTSKDPSKDAVAELSQKPAGEPAPDTTEGASGDPVSELTPELFADSAPSDASPKLGEDNKSSLTGKPEEHKFHPHQAKIFNELLEKTAPEVVVSDGKSYKHPVLIDGLLALGLLVAMAGFTLGVAKIYIVHEAKHDITDRRYTEAIALLKGAPLPGLFQIEGESPEELLDQARYLEAIEKLDKDSNDQAALQELDLIRPGSRFFEMANNIKGEHSPSSAITLEGGTEHEATPAEVNAADRPLLPENSDDHR